MPARHLYRIRFAQQGQVYEIYAREVSHEAMMGFVEIGEPVFGEKTQVVVDPSEERLKAEFEGVSRFCVPVHQVIRIDQVAKQGTARISEAGGDSGKVAHLPVFTPGKPGSPG